MDKVVTKFLSIVAGCLLFAAGSMLDFPQKTFAGAIEKSNYGVIMEPTVDGHAYIYKNHTLFLCKEGCRAVHKF